MKKTTYVLGYIAALVSVISLVFKINHWPMAGITLVVALSLLSIYLFFYITDRMSDSSDGKILPLHIIGGLSATFFTIGVLFKIEHWPLASILLVLGIAGFSIIFLPMLVMQKSKKEGAKNLMNSLGAIGLALFAIAIVSKAMHWPGPSVLFPTGAALVILIYMPMYMMNKANPHEKKVNELRNTFMAIIIGCFVILGIMNLLGLRGLPSPSPDAPPAPTEQVK